MQKAFLSDGQWSKLEPLLPNFRRLVVRYDYHIQSYTAFFHLACLLITLRHL